MAYVIAEPCIGVKDKACVEVCPVDCIYEGPNQLFLHPDECIDCGACEPVRSRCERCRCKPWKGDPDAAADGSAGGEHRVRAHVEYGRLAGGHPFTELRAVRRQPRTALIRLDAQELQTAGAVRPDDAVYGDHRPPARYRSRWRACGSRAGRIASR